MAEPDNPAENPQSHRITCRILPALLTALLMTISWHGVRAQDTGTGLDFLNIAPSAALLSISEASVTTTSGAAAIYANPSLLTAEQTSSLDLGYSFWVSNITSQFAGVNLRNRGYALAFSIYNSESDQFRPGGPGGAQAYPVGYISLAAGGSMVFGRLHLGLSAQYLREEVVEYRANGYALSTGFLFQMPILQERITVGASVMNIGTMQDLNLEATRVPSTLRAGVSTRLFELELPGFEMFPLSFTLHTDIMKPLQENPSTDFTAGDTRDPFYSIALTKSIGDLFLLQSGLRLGSTERPVSIGAALQVEPVRVNYALIPFSTGYGIAHSIGLQYRF